MHNIIMYRVNNIVSFMAENTNLYVIQFNIVLYLPSIYNTIIIIYIIPNRVDIYYNR